MVKIGIKFIQEVFVQRVKKCLKNRKLQWGFCQKLTMSVTVMNIFIITYQKNFISL